MAVELIELGRTHRPARLGSPIPYQGVGNRLIMGASRPMLGIPVEGGTEADFRDVEEEALEGSRRLRNAIVNQVAPAWTLLRQVILDSGLSGAGWVIKTIPKFEIEKREIPTRDADMMRAVNECAHSAMTACEDVLAQAKVTHDLYGSWALRAKEYFYYFGELLRRAHPDEYLKLAEEFENGVGRMNALSVALLKDPDFVMLDTLGPEIADQWERMQAAGLIKSALNWWLGNEPEEPLIGASDIPWIEMAAIVAGAVIVGTVVG